MQKRKIFMSWLASYIVILFFSMIFGVVIYAVASNIIVREVNKAYDISFAHMQNSIDTIFNDTHTIATRITAEPNVAFLAKKKSYMPDDYIKMTKLQYTMKQFMSANRYINDISLYFTKSDNYLSTNLFFNSAISRSSFISHYGADNANFQYTLERTRFRNILVMHSGFVSKLLYVYNYDPQGDESSAVKLIISLDYNNIKEMLLMSNTQAFMVDREGCYISSTDGEKILDEKASYIFYRDSEDYGIQYIYTVNKKMYRAQINYLNLVTFVYFMISAITGVAISFLFTKRNYDPVNEILSLIISNKYVGQNEYERIKAAITGLSNENTSYKNEIYMQNNAVRDHIFSGVVNRRVRMQDDFIKKCTSIGISMTGQRFLLIGISVENAGLFKESDFEDVTQNVFELLIYVIDNVLEELVNNTFSLFTANTTIAHVCLFNIPDEYDHNAAYENISSILNDLSIFLKKAFLIEISTAISTIRDGCSAISDAYTDVLSVLTYKDWSGSNRQFLWYDQIKTEPPLYPDISRLLDYIKNHEYQKAIMELSSLIIPDAPDPPEKLIVPVNEGMVQTVTDIVNYIDAHYNDPNITVYEIAELFHLHPSSLSRLFKKKMETGVLEYINIKRVENAKELIKSGLSIKSIAQLVGYYDTRPLIRAFKNIEGLTPNEYKLKNG